VRIRLFQGAHEESHSFNLHRQRWRDERPDLDSDVVQQKHIGISEVFTFEFDIEGEGDFDMLYHFGGVDDIWLGLWGIIRTYKERVGHLLPLPDRERPPKRVHPLPCPTGKKPPKAPEPSFPYPDKAIVKKLEVVAINTKIVYNESGDHDPHGIVFALKEDVPIILSGDLNPEPLILRVNVGEWVEITLTNQLTEPIHHEQDHIHGYPEVPVEAPFPPSKRISLHPQLVAYDVRTSDGATVGFNYDQTIGPGESITYRWFADFEIGAANLSDMADIRNHRHHGAFGMLIVEPRGSHYLDQMNLEEGATGSQVIVSNPLLPDFREFALLMHDGVRLVDKDGKLIIDPEPLFVEPEEEEEDFEDQGSRGFNYRNERFSHRVNSPEEVSKVFSSKVHGDPATPLFLAYAGDPVTVRFTTPADKPRAHAIALHGHKWLRSQDDVNSSVTAIKGQNVPGSHDNFELLYGAGGYNQIPGDYLYRSGNIRWDIELGLWGIMRVLGKRIPYLAPLKPNNDYYAVEEMEDLFNEES
jgi:manganese oxidase